MAHLITNCLECCMCDDGVENCRSRITFLICGDCYAEGNWLQTTEESQA